MRRSDIQSSDFRCLHCHHQVPAASWIAGVNNRNHCPYCLYSRHMDLREAGDRLAACRAEMRPVGLAMKRTHKKYGSVPGELMLIHQCIGCGKVSLNRIAADDDDEGLFALLEQVEAVFSYLITQDIRPLNCEDAVLVKQRLFGKN